RGEAGAEVSVPQPPRQSPVRIGCSGPPAGSGRGSAEGRGVPPRLPGGGPVVPPRRAVGQPASTRALPPRSDPAPGSVLPPMAAVGWSWSRHPGRPLYRQYLAQADKGPSIAHRGCRIGDAKGLRRLAVGQSLEVPQEDDLLVHRLQEGQRSLYPLAKFLLQD